ncbi:MAG: hypothetical protein MAG795_00029 [Candidatus Woesearchaeota archaeon]|nr:hypothetical protein [Candidatus Woesearchaeota archaeon]
MLTIPLALAQSEKQLVLFYSKTCPHCHEEIEFLNQIKTDYPDIEFNFYEISSPENSALLDKYAKEYDTTTRGVPRTFIADKVFIGFDPGQGELEYTQQYKAYIGYKNQIEKHLAELNNSNYNPQNQKTKTPFWIFSLILIFALTYPLFKKKRLWISGLVGIIILSLFLFVLFSPESIITSFASNLPFPLFVGVIALADGFNPCAFTVLFILLSLLTYTKNKKDMALVGLVFIIASALMYFIFISLMIIIGGVFVEKYGFIILKILGLVVLIAGAINIKDFFFFKKGVSLTISKKQKNKITKKASGIVKSLKTKTKLYAIFATFMLAIGVNIVELGCTAILPTVYMSSLITNFGSKFAFPHIMWTAVYSLIYVLPLFVILGNFIFSFKSKRISKKLGKKLKLVSGIFMLICGLILLLKPELLMFG